MPPYSEHVHGGTRWLPLRAYRFSHVFNHEPPRASGGRVWFDHAIALLAEMSSMPQKKVRDIIRDRICFADAMNYAQVGFTVPPRRLDLGGGVNRRQKEQAMKARKVKKATAKKAGKKTKGSPDLQLNAGRARSVKGGFAAVEHGTRPSTPIRPSGSDPFVKLGPIKGE